MKVLVNLEQEGMQRLENTKRNLLSLFLYGEEIASGTIVSISSQNKIAFFIKEKNGKDIPGVTIKKYLSFKAIDLLQEMISESDN